jgi:predicted Zn-dependent protease
MITKLTIVSMSLLLLANCSNKRTTSNKTTSNTVIVKENSKCKEIYKKYNEKYVLEENDSALIYINQAIECNPKSSDYKFTKIRFLVEIKNYNDAIKQLDEFILNSDDPAFKTQKGTLLLKINDKSSIKILSESYNDYKKIKNPTSNNQFYKIALDNYFEGKEYALKEVEKFKQTYKGKGYENQNINVLEELIKNETKENTLFKLFNIRD